MFAHFTVDIKKNLIISCICIMLYNLLSLYIISLKFFEPQINLIIRSFLHR